MSGKSENGGIARPAVCVDTLDYDGAETHEDSIEGEVTRHYYSCPSCGHPISTWMDCPECLWYDEDVWARTLSEEGVGMSEGGTSHEECGNCGGTEIFVLEDDTGNATATECADCGEVFEI